MLDTQLLRQGTIEVALDELSNEEVFKTHSKKIELIDRSSRDFFNSHGLFLTRCPSTWDCAKIHIMYLLNEGKLLSNLKKIKEIQ